ncbi:DNA primase [Paenibacillus sp. CMAA1364]
MAIYLIVEGKNDRTKLQRLLLPEINILCTFGTLNATKLEDLRAQVMNDKVILFMDNDKSGTRIRSVLRDAFPDALHLYTRRGYAGVEGTPDEYLVAQLEKASLHEYVIYSAQQKDFSPE